MQRLGIRVRTILIDTGENTDNPVKRAEVRERDRVERIVKLGGFVNCTGDFTDQPKVANGASELMAEVFGEAGKHARSAVGVPCLPLGVAVEVDAIVAVRAA